MSTYLLCSTPVYGHLEPLISIGQHLISRGHRVIVLTGSRFAERIASLGMEHRAFGGNADFDDRDVSSYLPNRDKYKGLAQAQYDIQTIFLKTIPEQYKAGMAIIATDRPDAILVDAAFVGLSPLMLNAAVARPPILAGGVLPLSQSSRDVAPYGMGIPPSSTPFGRLRNGALNLLARRVLFRETQRTAERLFAELGAPPLTQFVMDISNTFDRFLQFSAREFEYPRSDLATNTTFVGPVLPIASGAVRPDWWDEMDGSRPVVHVTQGTIDNRDFGRLIRPTVEGLADSSVLVVVSTGGRPASELGRVASNVRVAEFLPYDALLPLTDVYVTNAGFGGVQLALSKGVPMVAAGDTEDKPEVAARIAWSGTGINLRTGTPRPDAVRSAVHTVLDDPKYRLRAKQLAADIGRYTPLESVERELADAVAQRTG